MYPEGERRLYQSVDRTLRKHFGFVFLQFYFEAGKSLSGDRTGARFCVCPQMFVIVMVIVCHLWVSGDRLHTPGPW